MQINNYFGITFIYILVLPVEFLIDFCYYNSNKDYCILILKAVMLGFELRLFSGILLFSLVLFYCPRTHSVLCGTLCWGEKQTINKPQLTPQYCHTAESAATDLLVISAPLINMYSFQFQWLRLVRMRY